MPLEKIDAWKLVCDKHGTEGFEGDEIVFRVAESEKDAREAVDLYGGRVDPDGTVLCATCIEEELAMPSPPPNTETRELRDATTSFLAAFVHANRVDGTEEDWAEAYRKERDLRDALDSTQPETKEPRYTLAEVDALRERVYEQLTQQLTQHMPDHELCAALDAAFTQPQHPDSEVKEER